VIEEGAEMPVELGMLAETEIEETGDTDVLEVTEITVEETIDETDDSVGMAAKTPPA